MFAGITGEVKSVDGSTESPGKDTTEGFENADPGLASIIPDVA